MKAEEIVFAVLLLAGGYYLYKNPEILGKIFSRDKGGVSEGEGKDKSQSEDKGGSIATTIGKDKSGNDMIYPTAGKEWNSGTSWSGAYFPPVGNPKFSKSGDTMTISGDSPRLTVGGGWKSTEITFWMSGRCDWIAIHGGSDHHDKKGTKKGKWGGYAQKIYTATSDAGVQKEPIHGVYCRAVKKGSQGTSYKFGSNTGLKGIQRAEGNTVVLEAYINEGSGWKRLFREVDNGNFPCDKKAHTEGGPIIWIRFNGNANVQVKNLSVREIASSSPSTSTTTQSSVAYQYLDSYPVPLQNRGYPRPVRSIDREGL